MNTLEASTGIFGLYRPKIASLALTFPLDNVYP